MHISQSFDKSVFTARTKAELTELIIASYGCSRYSGTRLVNNRKVKFSCYVDNRSRDSHFILINYEKHRAKFSKTEGGKVKINEGHWVAFVYKISIENVVGAFQHLRNFHIVV